MTGTQTPNRAEHGEPPAEPRRRGLLGILVGLILAAGVVFGLIKLGGAAADFFTNLTGAPAELSAPDVPPGRPVTIEIPEGASARTIADILTKAAVVPSTLDFEVAVRTRAADDSLQAGEYELQTGMTPSEVIDILVAGPDIETFRLTVREGLRIGEVLAEIASQSPYTVAELESALLSGEVISAFVSSEADDVRQWEGALFPDTYEFFAETTAAEILQRLADQLERNIGSLDWTYVTRRGLSLYDALIMASLVEAETRVERDRPLVASVLFNRLEIGMGLQIDATVLYALDARGIGLTVDDLEIDSPYNTYRYPGLPPTPIGTVGMVSLEAVASPAETDFIYYVLTSADGAHSFTADYDEFLQFKAQAKEDGIIP